MSGDNSFLKKQEAKKPKDKISVSRWEKVVIRLHYVHNPKRFDRSDYNVPF